MDRRSLLKLIAGGAAAALAGTLSWAARAEEIVEEHTGEHFDDHIRDYLHKIKNYDTHFPDDVIVEPQDRPVLTACVERMQRLQTTIGYANFGLMGFDEARYAARRHAAVGAFTAEETAFMEKIYYRNAKDYGFFGEKVLAELTSRVPPRQTQKMPYTGHYLFRGAPIALYNKIRREIGPTIVLTSGVRGVMKQMYLFLVKAGSNAGNLSLASRSLAPPGHSFHGIGDFDVGKAGLGNRNFTEVFSTTDEYKKLIELGYINIRYTPENLYGVRFEPWHVKVV